MLRVRVSLLLLLATVVGARAPAAQGLGSIHGVVYDSLLHEPLRGAIVWVGGVQGHAVTDAAGRFRLDGVPAGRHVVAATHPGLEPVGLFTLTAAATVAAGDTSTVGLAVPPLGIFWLRGCHDTLGVRADSGIVVGAVGGATSGSRLAGAGLLASWRGLIQSGTSDVLVQEREVRATTDSLGAYYLCGVSTNVVVRVRGYARADSTGAIDVHVGPRGVARLNLQIGGGGRTAVLRGVVRDTAGQPIPAARVIVHEGASGLTKDDGTFLLSGLPDGTQWFSMHAIGRERFEQAVVLRAGDTTALDAALRPAALMLDPVRVLGARGARILAQFERRRLAGSGYSRTEDDIRKMGSMRGVLSTIPSVRFPPRARSVFDLTVLLPQGAGGLCVAPIFIDGELASYEQLRTYRTADLVGLEVYPRSSTVPQEFQSAVSTCGVVVVWTKFLR